ncbi:Aste57867_9627 [Aphanomyces stellatus]|uniref:Aste57867_9627 protein n=1 Tax=Aphanomyces stellatus TaxID=120398 RepID=A0A485KNW6_9STRA|nr:hypothetical protein As57867_009589 [Aphanomyces stellatus]VFT86506.1 Aste57867_9627 [Aphanomyces stellatus]
MARLWFRGAASAGIVPLRFLTAAQVAPRDASLLEGTTVGMHIIVASVEACIDYDADDDFAALASATLTTIFRDAFDRLFPGWSADTDVISAFFPRNRSTASLRGHSKHFHSTASRVARCRQSGGVAPRSNCAPTLRVRSTPR